LADAAPWTAREREDWMEGSKAAIVKMNDKGLTGVARPPIFLGVDEPLRLEFVYVGSPVQGLWNVNR
jgi:hypothetical protein